MNWIDLIVGTFCGSALLLAIYMGQQELASTIGVGLVGYLGGKASN